MADASIAFVHANVHIGNSKSGKVVCWVELIDNYRLLAVSVTEDSILQNCEFESVMEGAVEAVQRLDTLKTIQQYKQACYTLLIKSPDDPDKFSVIVNFDDHTYLLCQELSSGYKATQVNTKEEADSIVNSLITKLVFVDPRIVMHTNEV